ncbi:MAG: hypothetical protein D6771_02070, partial [Zetaproteobacteria bacterium]
MTGKSFLEACKLWYDRVFWKKRSEAIKQGVDILLMWHRVIVVKPMRIVFLDVPWGRGECACWTPEGGHGGYRLPVHDPLEPLNVSFAVIETYEKIYDTTLVLDRDHYS